MSKLSTRITRHTVKRALIMARGLPLTECGILDNIMGHHKGGDHVDLQAILWQLYKAEIVSMEGSPQGFVWCLNPEKNNPEKLP